MRRWTHVHLQPTAPFSTNETLSLMSEGQYGDPPRLDVNVTTAVRGSISDLTLWAVAPNETTIRRIAQENEWVEVYQDHLLGYFVMEEGTGNAVFDAIRQPSSRGLLVNGPVWVADHPQLGWQRAFSPPPSPRQAPPSPPLPPSPPPPPPPQPFPPVRDRILLKRCLGFLGSLDCVS